MTTEMPAPKKWETPKLYQLGTEKTEAYGAHTKKEGLVHITISPLTSKSYVDGYQSHA